MKIAFVSDTHFGYSRFEQDAQIQGTSAILDACQRADVLLLGGDIFDKRLPKLETLGHVITLLQRCQKELPDCGFPKILGVHGTHEARSKDSLNPIALLAKMGLMADVHNKTIALHNKNTNEKVAIAGMGGIPDDLVKAAFQKLSCRPQEGATNFFLFHQTLHEFVPQAKSLASIYDLPQGFDYYLCGHMHARKEFMQGKLLIPGSTVITQQKDEEQNPKGYYLIDTKTSQKEFIPIKVRPFLVDELKFEEAATSQVRGALQQKINEILKKQFPQPPIMKIKLKGSLKKGSPGLDLYSIKTESAFLTIDNQLKGSSLLDEISQLKGERMQRESPSELGMQILRQNAKKAGLEEQRALKLFEELSK